MRAADVFSQKNAAISKAETTLQLCEERCFPIPLSFLRFQLIYRPFFSGLQLRRNLDLSARKRQQMCSARVSARFIRSPFPPYTVRTSQIPFPLLPMSARWSVAINLRCTKRNSLLRSPTHRPTDLPAASMAN